MRSIKDDRRGLRAPATRSSAFAKRCAALGSISAHAKPQRVPSAVGLIMSAAAMGGVISASFLGALADRVGHWNVVVGCLSVAALLLVPQTFVTAAWQLVGLRFLMGIALGGLLPCVTSIIRHSVPNRVAGQMLGYLISAQDSGQVLGRSPAASSADELEQIRLLRHSHVV